MLHWERLGDVVGVVRMMYSYKNVVIEQIWNISTCLYNIVQLYCLLKGLDIL